MARDSLFDEQIIWSGRPKVSTLPTLYRLIAALSAIVSASTLCFALVVGTALQAHVGGMLAFSAWCATIALASWRVPLIWRSGAQYIITDKHVIWRRGRIRRMIDRDAISYALIRWNPKTSGTGDLVLVRAVPTGALRRTLTLPLADVEAPHRLWAVVRGFAPGAPLGDGDRPLAQRLDDGERVIWSAIPMASAWTTRRALTAAVALLLALASVRMVVRAVPSMRRVFGLHALPAATMALLLAGVAMGAVVLIAVALGVAYSAWIRPVRLSRATRYFVTNRRVLIRRGWEELHLDRARIAYVIAAPSRGLHDVFLVLDGPQARALAPMGAFGRQTRGFGTTWSAPGNGDGGALLPVFTSIEDAETVGAILHGAAEPELRDAA